VKGTASGTKQSAEKLSSGASGAKALAENKGLTAALKALRHPKSSFSANCKAQDFFVSARLKPCPFQIAVFQSAIFQSAISQAKSPSAIRKRF
jgi:hypothetical protein